MNFDYSKTTIAQGRDNQKRIQEEPNTFGKTSGADKYTQTSYLDKPKQRMAGRVGQRYLDYMTDKEEQKRTNEWMDYFNYSNEGAAFNQAKLNEGRTAEQVQLDSQLDQAETQQYQADLQIEAQELQNQAMQMQMQQPQMGNNG